MSPVLQLQSERNKMLLVAALLVLLCFAAFGINLNGPQIWDDATWVTNNDAVKHSHPGWIWIHQDSSPSYYPLTVTTFWIEYHIWGDWLAGYRIINILLHAASAFLLWRVLVEMKIPGALLAAAIWAVHPLQVESVVWITERKNTLSGVFFFGALLLWMRIIGESEMNLRQWKRYGWMLLLFVCALLSKATTIFLPVAALGVALIITGRIRRKNFLLTLPLFALAAIMAMVTMQVEHHSASRGYGEAWELTLAQRFILSGHCFWFYPAKIFWPSELITIYPKWTLNTANVTEYLWPISALVLIGALGILARRRRAFVPLCVVIIYLAGIFPVIGFFKFYTQIFTYVADHYAYLPGVSIIVFGAYLLTAGWRHLAQRMEHIKLPASAAIMAGGVLAISMTALSFGYASIYRNNFALWEEVIRVNPSAAVAYSNLGVYYYQQGEQLKALELFEKSLTLQRTPKVLANAAQLLEAYKQIDRAKLYYREAAAGKVYVPEVYIQLAKLEMAAGRYDAAIEACRMGLDVEPEWAVMWYGMATAYRERGQNDKALEAFKHYQAMVPRAADVYVDIGKIYQERGDMEKAISSFADGIKANPYALKPRRSLAEALTQKGLADEAAKVTGEADQLEMMLKQRAMRAQSTQSN